MLHFFSKVKKALSKTSDFLYSRIRSLFKGKIDEEALDKLEQLFYEADLGPHLSFYLVERVRKTLQQDPNTPHEELIQLIRNELTKELQNSDNQLKASDTKPTCILIVGINGSGKTTSVAKLARHFQKSHKKVLIVAADTFRAAAISQLDIWANKLQVDIVKGQMGQDPASVVFDAMNAALARSIDVVIIDTAGRLHVKTDLMQELEKMRRVLTKFSSHAPHETLLVLDATIGQNAIDQAKTFHKYTPLSGIILTKLDGTTKGGVAASIQKECNIPIKFMGTGESVDDLEPFDAASFVNALLP